MIEVASLLDSHRAGGKNSKVPLKVTEVQELHASDLSQLVVAMFPQPASALRNPGPLVAEEAGLAPVSAKIRGSPELKRLRPAGMVERVPSASVLRW